MNIITNPVFVSVIVLCLLCLLKLNVLMSILLASLTGAILAGIPITEAIKILCGGFSENANTALSYILLGTFATAISSTGLADMLSYKLSKVIGEKKKLMLFLLTIIAVCSQNLVPIHIAFIPILIPPLIKIMNQMKLDRRSVACSLAFGLKAPYIALPFGFGAIFMGIISDNMTSNGMEITTKELSKYNWILGMCMLIGLIVAIFITYSKPREYKQIDIAEENFDIPDHFTLPHYITFIAIISVVVSQIVFDSLALSALIGLLVLFFGRAIRWSEIDKQFDGGIKIMGMVAIVMLVSGGYSHVMKATGAVEELVSSAVLIMGGNKVIAATMITLIGLLVTMGIGSSFSTVPVIAVLYVPMCSQMGFSPAATGLLISAAAALGDAGSPASDTTLGPTAGLNVDGQHDHIWDTCVPTFLHFNIPLLIGAIIFSQFI